LSDAKILFFSPMFISFLHLKFELCQIKLGYRSTDNLAIHCQNFAQVRLQLKLAFRIRP